MQFFSWGINKPDIKEKRAALTEDHWKFWDQYDDRLIARGPVLNPDDPSTATGSIHIVELKDWDDARPIISDEPYAKAGLFDKIILTRFALGLERTQFEFNSQPDRLGFFIHCPAAEGALDARANLIGEHKAYCLSHDEIFVCRGALLTEDGDWNGSIFFVEVPSEEDATKFLEDEPYYKAGMFARPRTYRWRRGGRSK